MFKNRFGLVALLALVPLMMMSKAAVATTFPADRSGGSVGINLGGGSAGLSVDGAGSLGRESGAVGGLRLGRAINQNTAFELASSGWTKSQGGARVTFNAITAGLAFYPSGGLVLRTGVGLGTSTVSFRGSSSTETGLGLHAGVGYEFRVAKGLAISPEVNFGRAGFKGGSANWIGAGLGLDWYPAGK